MHGTCLTVDYPALFHTQFMILKIFGYYVRQVSVICDNPLESSYLVGNYLFNGWEGQKPFLCSMTKTSGDLYTFYVTGTEGIETARLSQIADRKDDLLTICRCSLPCSVRSRVRFTSLLTISAGKRRYFLPVFIRLSNGVAHRLMWGLYPLNGAPDRQNRIGSTIRYLKSKSMNGKRKKKL